MDKPNVIYRGPLSQCVTVAADQFNQHRFPHLGIYRYPRSTQYRVAAHHDEALYMSAPPVIHARLIFAGTFTELRHFAMSKQLELLKGPDDATPEKTV